MIILECIKDNPTGELYFKIQSLQGKIINVWLFKNVFNIIKQDGVFYACDKVVQMETYKHMSYSTIPIVYENNKLAVYYSYDAEENILSIDSIDIV